MIIEVQNGTDLVNLEKVFSISMYEYDEFIKGYYAISACECDQEQDILFLLGLYPDESQADSAFAALKQALAEDRKYFKMP